MEQYAPAAGDEDQLRLFRRLEISDYIKAAPEPPAEMYSYIHNEAEAMTDGDLRKLALRLLDDNREKLMYYPAASKNHHAEFGGLLYHMKRMLMTGVRVCEVYTNLNRDLVVTGVIIHDIEKINEIESNGLGISPGYSFEGKMLGRIIQGIKTIDRLTLEMDFPREKAIMLEHMILSHHYEPEFGSPKKPLFPEAEILHYLDIIDARMYDMEDALVATQPGEFSERVLRLKTDSFTNQWLRIRNSCRNTDGKLPGLADLRSAKLEARAFVTGQVISNSRNMRTTKGENRNDKIAEGNKTHNERTRDCGV